jgi:hypothetical protein
MKTAIRVLSLLLLAGVCSVTLLAQQDAGAAKPAEKGKAAPAMPAMKPSPEMTKMIKAMAGNWTTSETMQPSPMGPGGSGHGTARMWAGPGGMSLLQSYHSSGPMGSFSGAGTNWWDPTANAYRGVWCDNMTPTGCDASGSAKWEGDKLVGTVEGEFNGQKMLTRMTYSDFKPDSFVMTMESGPDASKLQKMMTITYTKATAKTAESAEKKQ